MFVFTSMGTWLGSSSHQGAALEIASLLVKGRHFKSWQHCAKIEQAAQESRLESNDRTLPFLPPPQAVAPSVEQL